MTDGDHKVEVLGREYVVTVRRKTHVVWTAFGIYQDHPISVQSRSVASAIAMWKNTAINQDYWSKSG